MSTVNTYAQSMLDCRITFYCSCCGYMNVQTGKQVHHSVFGCAITCQRCKASMTQEDENGEDGTEGNAQD